MHTKLAPGQQHTGRFAALDDVDRYGQAQALDLLCREGAVGLFAHTRPVVAAFAESLQQAGISATPHVWDLYHATLVDTQAAAALVLETAPQTQDVLAVKADWGEDMTYRCQQLMQRCGVMPAEEATLRNQRVPSLLAIASNPAGQLTGAGSLLWGHCPQGPWRDYAHLAMGCVEVAARGKSLGTRLAAALIQQSGHTTYTVGITAACAADNPASARLLLACGLQHDTVRVCAMFSLDGTRKTR